MKAMMGSSNALFALFFSFLVAMLAKEAHSQNTSFAINAFTPHSLVLTYERDAFVPPDSTYVSLTKLNGSGFPIIDSVGRVLYTSPVKMWEGNKQASFDTTITFEINGSGYGMTFFIVPVNSTTTTGGVGENLGIYDAVASCSPIVAVEVDLIISTSFDPGYGHIGININSQRSQNHTRIGDIKGQRVTARITYDVPTRKINVVATYGSETATVSFAYNLKALLPQYVQVGLSAATGVNWVAHFDAYTWHFNSTMGADVNTLVEDNTYIRKYGM